MRGVRAVVACGLVGLAAALVVALSQAKPRMSGSNRVAAAQFVVRLDPGTTICQTEDLVPGDTAALRLGMGTFGPPGPALRVTLAGTGGPVSRGGLRAGWRQGNHVLVPIRRLRRPEGPVRLCLGTSGPGTVVVAGAHPPRLPARTPTRAHPVRGRMRVEYLRPGRESWWSLLPTVVHRFGLGRSGHLGSWTFALAWALVLAAAVAAAFLLVGRRAG